MRIVYPQPACYETLRAMIYRIKRQYPFAACHICGRTLTGRALFGMSVGPNKGSALFVAGVHGQEWITSLVLLHFFENVCHAIACGEPLCGVDLREVANGIFILPCLNPDGVEIALCGAQSAGCFAERVARIGGDFSDWNANVRGVDLNHNFNAGWELLRQAETQAGITGPAPRRYGGPFPESEPETQALVRLCRRCRPCHAVALHTQGEEIYWNYENYAPERAALMAKLFAASSGYELRENEGLAAHGGFKDWFLQEFRRPAFTFELGKGQNPLPLADFAPIYERIEESLTLAAIC